MSWYKNVKNQKIIVAASMGLSGYYILSQAFAQLYKLPELLSKPIFSNVSVITIAAGISIAGIFWMYSKY